MGKEAFIAWMKEHQIACSLVKEPGTLGAYQKEDSINYWILYEVDVDGSVNELDSGTMKKVYDKLRWMVENRDETAGKTVTLQALYDWAKARGLENLPISFLTEDGSHTCVKFDYVHMDEGILTL